MFFTVRPLWLADLRIDQFPEVGLEALVRPLLISSHQARIARHIGGKDRCEATDRGHVLPGGEPRIAPAELITGLSAFAARICAPAMRRHHS